MAVNPAPVRGRGRRWPPPPARRTALRHFPWRAVCATVRSGCRPEQGRAMAQHLEVDEAPAGGTVKRRAFTALLACAALPVRAQGPPGTALPRIAWLSGARADAQSPFLGALRQGLAEAGRVEGR